MTEGDASSTKQNESTPGVAIMILGAAIAVLAPLFGLLGGSMAGSPDPNSTGQLFQYFVGGLLLGGVGVVIVYLGFRRLRQWRRLDKGSGS